MNPDPDRIDQALWEVIVMARESQLVKIKELPEAIFGEKVEDSISSTFQVALVKDKKKELATLEKEKKTIVSLEQQVETAKAQFSGIPVVLCTPENEPKYYDVSPDFQITSAAQKKDVEFALEEINTQFYRLQASELLASQQMGVSKKEKKMLSSSEQTLSSLNMQGVSVDPPKIELETDVTLDEPDIQQLKNIQMAGAYLISLLKKMKPLDFALAERKIKKAILDPTERSNAIEGLQFFKAKCAAMETPDVEKAISAAHFLEMYELNPIVHEMSNFNDHVDSLPDHESDYAVMDSMEVDASQDWDATQDSEMSQEQPEFMERINKIAEAEPWLMESVQKAWEKTPEVFEEFPDALFLARKSETGWKGQVGRERETKTHADHSMTEIDSVFMVVDLQGNIVGGYGVEDKTRATWKTENLHQSEQPVLAQSMMHAISIGRAAFFPDSINLTAYEALVKLEAVVAGIKRGEAINQRANEDIKKLLVKDMQAAKARSKALRQ
ncbi:hypothetical protein BDR26DRAFT_899786 [Obelidium mucronatum]|nr:hypothetical protein BDR26DRAFT_899786 [Obelidium mucronatum]